MFQRVFRFFSPPSPALPQSARRAAVRNFFLSLDIFPVCIIAPFTGVLCPLVTQPAFSHTALVFRAEDFPCVLPVCKCLRSVLIVCATLSLPLDKQTAQRLSAAFAHIPAFPLPCRCYVLGWLLAAAFPYTTTHRTFNHIRCICSILT